MEVHSPNGRRTAHLYVGYRELLKKYIRFLELHAGDNFVEAIDPAPEPMLTRRDLAELRTLAGEIYREAHAAAARARPPNYNYRLRLLQNRHGLNAAETALLAHTDTATVARWRTSPSSDRYLTLSRTQFEDFETELQRWLDEGRPPLTPQSTATT